MNGRHVVFGSFVLLAASLNFVFFTGDISDPSVHDVRVLFAALAVTLIATGLNLGDRTHLGAMAMAATLVVDVQMVAAVLVWAYAGPEGPAGGVTPEVVSLSGGALMASAVSVALLTVRTIWGGTFPR